MTTMSNFPEDMVGEILSRVPLTSLSEVRCTCKTWNALSKIQILGKETGARKHVLGFMVLGSRVCSLRIDLQGIPNERNFGDPSIKQIRILDHIERSHVFHSGGLLLCVFEDNRNLMVWNPYLGETRWIHRPKIVSDRIDMFAFGYNNDNNRNHKILTVLDENDREDFSYRFGLYDFASNSWRRVLDVKPDFDIYTEIFPVSLKGNNYFLAYEKENFLICFDFTTERFGPRLPLPFQPAKYKVALSCVREEQLAFLHQDKWTMEIWITTNILPNAVSWSKFLKVETTLLNGFEDSGYYIDTESFFIDEEKKVVVAFDKYYEEKSVTKTGCFGGAHIIGEDGYLKFMKLGSSRTRHFSYMFSSYVPSLVQLRFNQPGKRKDKVSSYPKRKKERRN